MNLWADFLTNDQRGIHKWAHYFPAYERHLERFRNRSSTMLEIGAGAGGSAQMWSRFLGPFAQVVAIDCRPTCKEYESDQIAVRIGDQEDPDFLTALLDEFGPFEIVLDDGGHHMSQIAASFTHLYPTIPCNGVYLVEDLHTAYQPAFGGGLGSPDSFIEKAKTLIDELYAGQHGAPPVTDFGRSTLSMHFYDSLLVFEKGRHLGKRAFQTGTSTAHSNVSAYSCKPV
jgi:hypothetical protein